MNFTKNYKYFAILSAAIILVGIVMACTVGANIGVDFSGGTLFTLEMGQDFDVNDVSDALAANGITDAPVVKSGTTGSEKTQAVIRLKAFADDQTENATRQAIVDQLAEKYPNVEVAGVDRVGAVASAELVRNAAFSVLIAGALILIYIWIRFELMSGVAAVIALLHDVLIMISLTVILRIQINSSFIAAVLTIVGYSINNTIVIFDRVRENTKLLGKNKNVDGDEIINRSVKETLTRSINTSITTLVTILALYVLGVDSIREFALPIIVGLLAGTYSSVFLAAPLWGSLRRLQQKKSK